MGSEKRTAYNRKMLMTCWKQNERSRSRESAASVLSGVRVVAELCRSSRGMMKGERSARRQRSLRICGRNQMECAFLSRHVRFPTRSLSAVNHSRVVATTSPHCTGDKVCGCAPNQKPRERFGLSAPSLQCTSLFMVDKFQLVLCFGGCIDTLLDHPQHSHLGISDFINHRRGSDRFCQLERAANRTVKI